MRYFTIELHHCSDMIFFTQLLDEENLGLIDNAFLNALNALTLSPLSYSASPRLSHGFSFSGNNRVFRLNISSASDISR